MSQFSFIDNFHKNLRRFTTVTFLAAFATVLGYIDSILPVLEFLPIPGVKLGLANAAVLLTLWIFGAPEALTVSLVRILLVNLLLFPSPTGLLFSLSGGVLSFCSMVFTKKLSFHPITVSVIGSICHNIAQTAAAVVLFKTPQLFSYLLFLLPVGCLCGALLGILTALLLPRLQKILKISKYTGEGSKKT